MNVAATLQRKHDELTRERDHYRNELADAIKEILTLQRAQEETRAREDAMADAAEMLWAVLANVSGGDWTKQPEDWQEYAARWRDSYFAALTPYLAAKRQRMPLPSPPQETP